jgi:hypothetical protein
MQIDGFMKNLQDIHAEKVIANLGGTSFMTETGKVIEGNYRVGEYAPVIYDKTSLRYLPVWKKSVDLPIVTPIRHEEMAAKIIIETFPYLMAQYTFKYGEKRIYFALLGARKTNSGIHFFIDLTDIEGMGPWEYVAFLRVVEDRADMGVIIFRQTNPYPPVGTNYYRAVAFVVKGKCVPEEIVEKDGWKYHKREFDHNIEDFDDLDSTLVDIVPDKEIALGHPQALGYGEVYTPSTILHTGPYCPIHFMEVAVLLDASHAPFPYTEVEVNKWAGEKVCTLKKGHYSLASGFIHDQGSGGTTWRVGTYLDHVSTTKTGIASLRDGMYSDKVLGKEKMWVGLAVWATGDTVSSIQWEFYLSARVEWNVEVNRHAVSGYDPHVFSICGLDVTLPGPQDAPSPSNDIYYVKLPFLFVKARGVEWECKDLFDIPSTIYYENRTKIANIYGPGFNLMYNAIGNCGAGEYYWEDAISGKLHYRFVLPNSFLGRYRKVWGIPNGVTTVKPKILVDYTKVEYDAWSLDWRVALNSFKVKTFLRLDAVDYELVGALNTEDKWEFTGTTFVLPDDTYHNRFYRQDYHGMPPVHLFIVSNPDIYRVGSGYYDPGSASAYPQRMPYKHFGGGIPNRFMARICPVKSQGKDRSVYVIQGTIYDYNVELPGGEGRVSRELIVCSSQDMVPKIDTEINEVTGDATVTFIHPSDPGRNLTGQETIYSASCDVGKISPAFYLAG